jgi:DNA-binding response OmpR family regulator
MKNQTTTILFIEDELSLAEIVKETLELRGFEVIHQATAMQGLISYHERKPDIILLDITLPDSNGYNIARTVRLTNTEIPIIFLTSRSLPQDVVEGFEQGGNDYMKKPFSMEELIIRIRALLSKNRNLLTDKILADELMQIGKFKFNLHLSFLQVEDNIRNLTSREAELLRLLLLNKNQVIERKELLKKIWGNDDFFSGRSLDVFITKLRNYFRSDPSIRIMNIRGVGYKLIF